MTAPRTRRTPGAVPAPVCRICGSGSARLRVRLEGYAVYRCRACDAVYTDLPAGAIDGLYDESYFESEFGPYFSALFGETDDSALRTHFAGYLDEIERVARPGALLDIGCAAGLFLDVARGRGWSVDGVEISEHAAAVARERRHVPVRVGDVMDLDLPCGAYDVVTMLDVLEHLADPGAMLDRVHDLLAPGGALALVLPNDRNLTTMIAMALHRASFGALSYPASRVHQIYHVTYFTPGSISRLLADHGFEVVAVRPDETVRGLLNESPVMRAAVGAVFGAARLLGLQNKMLVIARPRASGSPSTRGSAS